METIPCTICKQPGHLARKCPELTNPLKEGFQGGGGGGHSHEEDDACMRNHDLCVNILLMEQSMWFTDADPCININTIKNILPL